MVTSLIDPDPRVNGNGIKQLQEAGIEVDHGFLEQEARQLHAGYIMRQTQGRPVFTLKMAQSLDGRIATSTGQSQWISCEVARRYAHILRARHDAILVGSGTALADDPQLTCRLDGLFDRSPHRIVLDRRLRLPIDSKLVKTAREVPVWVFTHETDEARLAGYRQAGVRIFNAPSSGLVDIARTLGQEMISSVMIEGGGQLAASFLRADLIDRLDVVIASMALGGDGLPSIAELGLDHVDEATRWSPLDNRRLGDDRLLSFYRTTMPA